MVRVIHAVSGEMERWVVRSRLRSERFLIPSFLMKLLVNLSVPLASHRGELLTYISTT